MSNYLDQMTQYRGIVLGRMTWEERPDLPEEDFCYSPYYGFSGRLLWSYEESDLSFRKRLLKHIEGSNL